MTKIPFMRIRTALPGKRLHISTGYNVLVQRCMLRDQLKRRTNIGDGNRPIC